LDLLRKTALVTKGMPDFSGIRPKYIIYKSYNTAKLLCQPFFKAIINPPNALGRIKGDIFVIRFIPVNLCGLTGLSKVQYRRLQGVSPL